MKFLKIFFLLVACSCAHNAFSQAMQDYHALVIANSYTPTQDLIQNGTRILFDQVDDEGLEGDDAFTMDIDLTFPFIFNGVTYTKVAACSNGHLNFGTDLNTREEFDSKYPTDWNGTTTAHANRFYAAVLQNDAVSPGGYYQIDASGGPGKTIFIFQCPASTISYLTDLTFGWEIRLYQDSNKIEFAYDKTFPTSLFGFATGIVGVRGDAGTGNYTSVDLSDAGTAGIAKQSHTQMFTLPGKNPIERGIRFIVKTANDIEAVSIDSIFLTHAFTVGVADTPKATFKNIGWEDQINFYVYFEVADAMGGTETLVYRDSQLIAPALLGKFTNQSTKVTFAPWTPIDSKNYVLRTFSRLATDTSVKNDTAKRPASVTPVTLAFVSTSIIGSSAHILWSTSLEENLFSFTVERLDNGEWKKLGEVTAKNYPNSYSFIDEKPKPGINFYRLNILEKDGAASFSPTVSASLRGIKLSLGQNYPNPFNPSTMIPYDVAQAGPVKLTIMNILGNPVATVVDKVSHPAGSFVASFDASSLPTSSYFYRIESGTTVITKSMTVTK